MTKVRAKPGLTPSGHQSLRFRHDANRPVVGRSIAMTTSLAPDAKNKDWTEPGVISASDPRIARAEWLWTLFGLVLFGAFLSFVVDDFPLRALIAGN